MGRVKVTVDSAACETVGPKRVASAFNIKPTQASLNNVNYVAANGTKICNYGERNIKGLNDDWNKVGFAMQVADVNKVLMAVNQMVDAGNIVHFEEGNHHILNYKTGYRTEMDEVNGQYTFDMWVPNLGNTLEATAKKKHVNHVNSFQELASEDDENDEEEGNTDTPFQRQP